MWLLKLQPLLPPLILAAWPRPLAPSPAPTLCDGATKCMHARLAGAKLECAWDGSAGASIGAIAVARGFASAEPAAGAAGLASGTVGSCASCSVTPAAIAGATSSGALGWTVMPSRPRAASSELQRIRATSSSNADAPRRARGAFRLVLIARPSECGRRPAPGCRPVSTLLPFSLPKQAVWALVHH